MAAMPSWLELEGGRRCGEATGAGPTTMTLAWQRLMSAIVVRGELLRWRASAGLGLAAMLGLLCAGLTVPSRAGAIAGVGPHETVDITTSTERPNTSATLGFAATYRNPTDPNADPPPLRRLVISLPGGTRIDTSVPARCTASDEQLRLIGDAACPPASRVGSGQVTVDITGLGKMTFKTTRFNGPDQQIEVVESGNAVGSNGVIRAYIHGTTLDAPVPTCLTGGQPPTGCPFDQVTVLSNQLTTMPITVGHGKSRRSYGTTPPTCPHSHTWRTPVTFHYADGTVETVVSTQPCKPSVRQRPRDRDRWRKRPHTRHPAR